MSRQLKPDAATAKQALARCSNEPEFEASLRAAYQGRHDVLDALSWAAHPLTVSPRGVDDPARGLRELQRAVFSRSAADSPAVEVIDPETGATLRIRESERRLREAERDFADDAQQLTAALVAVGLTAAPAVAEQLAPEPEPEPIALAPIKVRVSRSGEPLPGGSDRPPDSGPEDDTGSPAAAARPRRKFLLPALAGMGLLSAILLLPTLLELNAGADSEPSPSSTAQPRIMTEIVTLGSDGHVSDPFAILKRPLAESDHPPIGFPDYHETGSFRALPGMVAHVQLYLARGVEPETICLLVVQPNLMGMSGCVPDSVFAEQGIQLSGGGRYDIGADATILTESYSLMANGDFHYEATARVRAQPPTGPEGSPELEGGVEGS